MQAMEPVWKFLNGLEGFEFAAFWISFFTFVALTGFFIDYIMQRQGFGPFFNALLALGGVFAGLYVRYNFLQGYEMQLREPYLSLGSILAITAAMLITMAFVRNRTS